jgi:predicted ArsR family transcriptional regulator
MGTDTAHPERAAAAALAHPSRHQIADELAGMRGATVAELANAVGLHPNAVRKHLSVLAAAGVVWSERERQTGRVGRPSVVYRLSDPEAIGQTAGRRTFLTLLLRLAARANVSEEDVEEVGAEEGRELAASGDSLAQAFQRSGFAPDEVTDAAGTARGEYAAVLRHCAFAEAASGEHGELVCALHRGIARGFMAARGGELVEFVPTDPYASTCRVVVREGQADPGQNG